MKITLQPVLDKHKNSHTIILVPRKNELLITTENGNPIASLKVCSQVDDKDQELDDKFYLSFIKEAYDGGDKDFAIVTNG